eukprot:m.155337 g.155337  ORF g.155337 m.155337 type:complete len:271 (+) comp38669_c1_seq2:354-1166(+)
MTRSRGRSDSPSSHHMDQNGHESRGVGLRIVSLGATSSQNGSFHQRMMRTSSVSSPPHHSRGGSEPKNPPTVPPRPLATFLYDEEGVYIDPPQVEKDSPPLTPSKPKASLLRKASQPMPPSSPSLYAATAAAANRKIPMRRQCTVPVGLTKQTSGSLASTQSHGRRNSSPTAASSELPKGRRITPPSVQRATATRTFSDGALKLKKTLSTLFGRKTVSKTNSDPESSVSVHEAKRREEEEMKMYPNSGPIKFVTPSAPPPPLPPRNDVKQ